MDIFDKLPEIQKKYINRRLFQDAVKLTNISRGDIDLINECTENDPNKRRYCKLVLRYT
jgi:hypothetical protein